MAIGTSDGDYYESEMEHLLANPSDMLHPVQGPKEYPWFGREGTYFHEMLHKPHDKLEGPAGIETDTPSVRVATTDPWMLMHRGNPLDAEIEQHAGSLGPGKAAPIASKTPAETPKLELKFMGKGRGTERLVPFREYDPRYFSHGGEHTEHHELMVGDKSVGFLSVTKEHAMPSNNQHLHVEFVDGVAGKNNTAAERLNAMVQFQKAVAEAYPEAVGIYGLRISGGKARYGGDAHQFVPLKEGWDRKSLQEDIAPWTVGTRSRPRDAEALRQRNWPAPQLNTPRPSDERTEQALRAIQEALRAYDAE